MSANDFYKLPRDVKERVMAEACQAYHVDDFYDLDPEVRHRIYEAAQ